MRKKASIYANAAIRMTNVMQTVIAFIDDKIIGIARPGHHNEQSVVFNGHKRKHAFKYQTLASPDGLFVHAAGPIEVYKHGWTLYIRSS